MQIIKIQTSSGAKAVKAIPQGEHLAIHQNGSVWMISHLHTGAAIACFREKSHALAMGCVLSNLRVDWGFFSQAEMPEETKQKCHEIFKAFRGILSFSAQKKS